MILETAPIFTRNWKTDDQLKGYLATHPWVGSIHGFHNATPPWLFHDWRNFIHAYTGDSVFVDGGIGMRGNSWIDRCMETMALDPGLICLACRDKHEFAAEEAWWRATVRLVVARIPDSFCFYRVYYGHVEDEAGPKEADEAWKRLLCEAYNYNPNIVALFEPTAA
jgi:hypothetical protein